LGTTAASLSLASVFPEMNEAQGAYLVTLGPPEIKQTLEYSELLVQSLVPTPIYWRSVG